MTDHHVIILGAGAAGLAATAALTRAENVHVTLVARTGETPTIRMHITGVAFGPTLPHTIHAPLPAVAAHHDTAVHIDAAAQTVTLSSGTRLHYDTLLIGTGSQPRALDPHTPGLHHPAIVQRVTTLHSLNDAEKIRERLQHAGTPARVAIYGGGFTGAEAASTLRDRGHHVALISRTRTPGETAFGPAVAARIAATHRARITNFPGRTIAALHPREDSVGITLDDTTLLSADLLIVALGTTPTRPVTVHSGNRRRRPPPSPCSPHLRRRRGRDPPRRPSRHLADRPLGRRRRSRRPRRTHPPPRSHRAARPLPAPKFLRRADPRHRDHRDRIHHNDRATLPPRTRPHRRTHPQRCAGRNRCHRRGHGRAPTGRVPTRGPHVSASAPVARARGGFCLAVTGTILLMAAASAPSPFYPQLTRTLQLPAVAGTLIFAIYAVPLLLALLTLGSVSDRVGRRRILTIGSVLLSVSLIMFWAAGSLPALLAARAVQGLAAGLLVPALNAMMVDFEPARWPGAAALANTAAPMAGLGLGAITAAAMLDTPGIDAGTIFLVLAALFTLVAATSWAVPDSAGPRTRDRRPVRRDRIPAVTRRIILLIVPAVIAGWVTNGMFLALGTGIVATQFNASTRVQEAAPILVLAAAGVLGAALLHHSTPRTISVFGSAALGAGTLFSVLDLYGHSYLGYLASVAVVGAGFGTAFMGAMRTLLPHVDLVHRARVMAVIYTISYLAMSVPVVVAGLLVPWLTLPGATVTLAAVVVLLSASATLTRLRYDDRAATGISNRHRLL